MGWQADFSGDQYRVDPVVSLVYGMQPPGEGGQEIFNHLKPCFSRQNLKHNG